MFLLPNDLHRLERPSQPFGEVSQRGHQVPLRLLRTQLIQHKVRALLPQVYVQDKPGNPHPAPGRVTIVSILLWQLFQKCQKSNGQSLDSFLLWKCLTVFCFGSDGGRSLKKPIWPKGNCSPLTKQVNYFRPIRVNAWKKLYLWPDLSCSVLVPWWERICLHHLCRRGQLQPCWPEATLEGCSRTSGQAVQRLWRPLFLRREHEEPRHHSPHENKGETFFSQKAKYVDIAWTKFIFNFRPVINATKLFVPTPSFVSTRSPTGLKRPMFVVRVERCSSELTTSANTRNLFTRVTWRSRTATSSSHVKSAA